MADVKKLNNMFLVNAPAGSGKTTYIENTIINLLAQYPNRRILSITYTNRAKEELNSRINSKNVTVDTIHSFLSDFVGLYFSKPEVIDLYLQVFEKKIKALIDNGEDDSKNARYIDKFGKLDFETIKNNLHKVFYNEQSYSSYYYGGLSHDDMLLFCRKMFEKFEMLKKRLSNKYRYIFIDEYQDTSYGISRNEFKQVDIKGVFDIILFTYQGVRMYSQLMPIPNETPERIIEQIKLLLLNKKTEE